MIYEEAGGVTTLNNKPPPGGSPESFGLRLVLVLLIAVKLFIAATLVICIGVWVVYGYVVKNLLKNTLAPILLSLFIVISVFFFYCHNSAPLSRRNNSLHPINIRSKR